MAQMGLLESGGITPIGNGLFVDGDGFISEEIWESRNNGQESNVVREPSFSCSNASIENSMLFL